jgi:hypothetical protein
MTAVVARRGRWGAGEMGSRRVVLSGHRVIATHKFEN